MALDQLKAFLTELQKNKELLNAIRVAATANEIAKIALGFGYQYLFSMYEKNQKCMILYIIILIIDKSV